MRLCLQTAVTVSLSELILPRFSEAVTRGELKKTPVIWLGLASCTGETVSIENAFNPTIKQLWEEIIDLRYHWLLSPADGSPGIAPAGETMVKDAGNYILIVEGSVVTRDEGRYNYAFERDGQLVTGLRALKELGDGAKYVLAIGDCAAFGGPGAAYPNPSRAKGVWDVLGRKVVNIPGCPIHPDWVTGTLTHLIAYGYPELDSYNRPKLFFGRLIHDRCQRRQQFEDGIFARFPGDEGCLYTVGCKGPVTYADCPERQWNHYVNWNVRAGTPCIGCTTPHFPDGMTPYFEHLTDITLPGVRAKPGKVAAAAGTVVAGAIGTHLAGSVITKRLHRHYVDGTKPIPTAPAENAGQLANDLDELIKEQEFLLSQVDVMTGRKPNSAGQKSKSVWRRLKGLFSGKRRKREP